MPTDSCRLLSPVWGVRGSGPTYKIRLTLKKKVELLHPKGYRERPSNLTDTPSEAPRYCPTQ